MSPDCDHDWEHVETDTDGPGVHVHGDMSKYYKCRECGAEREDVYTVQTRYVNGSKVRL